MPLDQGNDNFLERGIRDFLNHQAEATIGFFNGTGLIYRDFPVTQMRSCIREETFNGLIKKHRNFQKAGSGNPVFGGFVFLHLLPGYIEPLSDCLSRHALFSPDVADRLTDMNFEFPVNGIPHL